MPDLQEIAYGALREIYREAEPPLDFDDVLENPQKYDEKWYLNHELDSERQNEILNKHLEQHNLSSREKMSIRMTVILEYGPSSNERLQ